MVDQKIQQRLSSIGVIHFRKLHSFPGIPEDFKPWECGLSPSALYNCSLTCRKQMGIKTPEVKWMSIKRWVTTTPEGVKLPVGVYFSIKRKEKFVPLPDPHFDKKEFVLMMFPYGNVWSQIEPDVPINEEWIMSENNGITVLEHLMQKDAAFPVNGYFASCFNYMQNNKDQLWIHMKRRRKEVISEPVST